MAGPPLGVAARLRARGPFVPNARLDTGQVTDMRAPPPMDVRFDKAGHPVEWFDTANAGGISWNPDIWQIEPGPLNQGHLTPREQARDRIVEPRVKKHPPDSEREGGRAPGQGHPQAQPLRRTGLQSYSKFMASVEKK